MKSIIFDLDGTLIDSILSIKISCDQALQDFSYPEYSVTDYKRFIGNGSYKIVQRALAAAGITDQEIIAMVHERYMLYFDRYCTTGVVIYPGIIDLLQKLKALGYQLIVYSNKPDEQTKKVVATFFGDETFALVWGGKDDRSLKPYLEGTKQLLKAAKSQSETTIIIGDSKTDMETAANANIFSIGVTWGFQTEEQLEAGKARAIAHQTADVLRFVAEWEKHRSS